MFSFPTIRANRAGRTRCNSVRSSSQHVRGKPFGKARCGGALLSLAVDQRPMANPVTKDMLTIRIGDLKDDGKSLDAERPPLVAVRSRFARPGRRANILVFLPMNTDLGSSLAMKVKRQCVIRAQVG